jgi:hypothetical protein
MSAVEARLMELGTRTASAVIDHGLRRAPVSLSVMVATAWQMGLELGLAAGIEDVALARVVQAAIADAVGHGPAERAEVGRRAAYLLEAAAEEVRR